MQRFTELYLELDRSNRTSDKLKAIASYFREAPPEDAIWAAYLLAGGKIGRTITSRQMRDWASEASGFEPWLVNECYHVVGDLSETLSLLIPFEKPQGTAPPLHEIVEQRLKRIGKLPPEQQREMVLHIWRELTVEQRFIFHKLISGNYRVGVSRQSLILALAQVAEVEPSVMAHRLAGKWSPEKTTMQQLLAPVGEDEPRDANLPYPFMLAHALNDPAESLGAFGDWQIEWKWDGIRAQIIRRQGKTAIWSRGDELISGAFPELMQAGNGLPEGTVLDGEIVAWDEDAARPRTFTALQTRLNRKNVEPSFWPDVPVLFVAFDVLEWDGIDLRQQPLSDRRAVLERAFVDRSREREFTISKPVDAASWEQLAERMVESRDRAVEGVMLKRRDSTYHAGRPTGPWWKLKVQPYTVDAVLIAAQPGTGRRAGLLTDYTFGVWDDGRATLVPVAKAYSGLTDAEIGEMDRFVRSHTTGRFGPVHAVEPLRVFELGFEAIQRSDRHKSGIAVRFPRILRLRDDKKPQDADTLATLRELLATCEGRGGAGLMANCGRQRVEALFRSMGREPFAFQRQTWDAYRAGESGLIQAPTGMGKTLAAALGPAIEMIDEGPAGNAAPPLTLIWVTPLRALAADTVESLKAAMEGLGLKWSIELRTSDTSASVRKRQRERLPTVLVTTPESVSLLLSYTDSPGRFGSLRCVVVDEWHELMSSKRGVQTELALARLRTFQPALRTWGLSATMSNLREAGSTLLGHAAADAARIIHAPDDKPILVESVFPPKIERFPWAGHLGLHLLKSVVERIESAGTTLLFTNTRSQSELWFGAIMGAQPDWLGKIAIHHGSIDRKTRAKIEQMLRAGELRAVVCTSSLDLGVDFWPVDQVIQIGSPKSIARAMQRAGRCGHRPGMESRILCVPTQAFELIEFSAARHSIQARHIESREPVTMALDVLAQHVVTVAAGGGFDSKDLFEEVRSTHAFAAMTEQHWSWVMDFAERGGPTLTAYPRFARIRRGEDGCWTIASDAIARMHRMGIGTITSDGSVAVQYMRGKRLGTVEESFVAKLKAGDTFAFAGKVLEFVRVHQMSAIVKPAKRKSGLVPRWMGGRLPMSASLAHAVRLRLEQAADGNDADNEMRNVRPILDLQRRWSAIPRSAQLLVESTRTREGHHHFFYPFQGRLVHEGLAALLAFRLARRGVAPVTATFNDYGFELLSPNEVELSESDCRELLSPDTLLEDIVDCVNSSELARRHFREIARIAGLLVQTRPGAHRSVRQLQASSELFFDVFKEFDPENLLMQQARREVLERQLEFARLRGALERVALQQILITTPHKLSPLSFPLWAERIASQQLRLESSTDRIERLARQLEAAAVTEDAGNDQG